MTGPESSEFVGRGQVTIAVMENVGDGKIIIESCGNQDDSRQDNGGKRGNARTARRFAQSLGAGTTSHQPDQPCHKGINAQGKGEQERKAAYL